MRRIRTLFATQVINLVGSVDHVGIPPVDKGGYIIAVSPLTESYRRVLISLSCQTNFSILRVPVFQDKIHNRQAGT